MFERVHNFWRVITIPIEETDFGVLLFAIDIVSMAVKWDLHSTCGHVCLEPMEAIIAQQGCRWHQVHYTALV